MLKRVFDKITSRKRTFCRRFLMIIPVAALALAGCSGKPKPKYAEKPVDEIYNEAINLLQEQQFSASTEKFDEVERQHPYSVWATKAQLMAAYAYYQASRYDDAVVALDRFIQLHPANKDISYAYYLKALCYYEQISDVVRDQKMTELALRTLKELVVRFPTSKYARDAKLKLDLTYDHLAGKEMEIGRYYHKQGHYLAAINRFKVVIAEYQTTTHVPEALHRVSEAYYALGLPMQAKNSAAVLGHNFPGSEWYIDSYELIEKKKIRKTKGPEKKWYQIWKGF